MLSEYQCLRKLGSFSIDDPEAARKLIENLDRRRVRVQVLEACWHFGFTSPDGLDRMRVKGFLDDLCARGELIQAVAGLYCRPDMTEGRASVDEAVKQLESLRDLKKRLKAEQATTAEPPVPKPTPRKMPEPKRAKMSGRTYSPASVTVEMERPDPPQAPAPIATPKPRSVSGLQRQTEWILLSIRARGGQASKSVVAAAAVAEGIITTPSDIDVPLQHLFNRTRVYLKDHLLTFTQFGERDAEYLDLRRDALARG